MGLYSTKNLDKKCIQWILINIILLFLIIFSLYFFREKRVIQSEDTLFAIGDISLVDRLLIGEISMKKKRNGRWLMNDTYYADSDKMYLLLAMLQHIEIKRHIPESIKGDIIQNVNTDGKQIKIYADSTLLKSYILSGDSQNTYVLIEGENVPHIIYAPGYLNNIYRFCNIDLQKWRDKRALYTQWHTLKKLSLTYHRDENNSFSILFDKDFYVVEKLNQLDSSVLYDYIGHYTSFKAFKFLSDSNAVRDSLSHLPPVCTISVEDLYPEQNETLFIYPGNPFFYGILKSSDKVVILKKDLMRRVLVNRSFFEKKKKK